MNRYLNTDRKACPSAPQSAVCFLGNGANIIYMDWEHDLVAVVRWFGGGGSALDEFVGKIIAAVTQQEASGPLLLDYTLVVRNRDREK